MVSGRKWQFWSKRPKRHFIFPCKNRNNYNSVLTNCLRSIWRRRKNKNCWRPIDEMLEARLWVAGGTTSLIGDISFLWNIPTGDKWKVYSKYQFTHNVMKHASIYIDACWRPFLWNKLDWRSLTGFRRYAAATTAPRWCCQKNDLFTKKGQNELWM